MELDRNAPIRMENLSLSFCGLEGAAAGAVIADRLRNRPMLTHLRLKVTAQGPPPCRLKP